MHNLHDTNRLKGQSVWSAAPGGVSLLETPLPWHATTYCRVPPLEHACSARAPGFSGLRTCGGLM